MNTLIEKVVIETRVPKPAGRGLSDLITQLKSVHTYITQINQQMAGLTVAPQFKRSIREIESEIKKLQTSSGGLQAANLAKGLGFDVEHVRKFFQQAKRELDGFKASTEEFLSAPKAAKAFAMFARQQQELQRAAAAGLKNMFTPAVGQVGSASAGGKIELAIPAAQIQASVVGPITLQIPGSQIAGSGGGGGPRDPGTGRFIGGGGGGGGGGKGKGKGKKGTFIPGGSSNEIARTITETENDLKTAVRVAKDVGTEIETTYNSLGDVLKTVTRKKTGQTLLSQLRGSVALEKEAFKQAALQLDKSDFLGLAKLQQKLAAQLTALVSGPSGDALKAAGLGPQAARVLSQAQTISAQAFANSAGTSNASSIAAYNAVVSAAAARSQLHSAQQQKYMNNVRSGQWAQMNALIAQLPPGQRAAVANAILSGPGNFHPQMGPLANAQILPPVIPYTGPKPPKLGSGTAAQTPMQRALGMFTPGGFASSLVKVSGWAMAVGTLYKSLELANYSLSRMVELGAQTARLEQVFRGVGGSAKQLTDDVLALAAANGRSTDEAMEAAVAWSRMGLSRKEVNEAVRVSLVAANVAEISAGEATQHLSSLMVTYKLRVSELNSVLGMLNNTSNKYRVTNKDLLEGMSRSAAVAQQSGVSLAELQGLIGAGVSATGQSGANMGNAVKTIFTRLNNPQIQDFLRDNFKIESMSSATEVKSGSERLRELFLAYEKMTQAERNNLMVKVAGATQANRFVAIMQNYITAQKMAADGLMNLNSAEAENAKITGTVKSQWAALRAEFDRQLNSAGNGGGGMSLMGAGAQWLRSSRLLLRADSLRRPEGLSRFMFPGLKQANDFWEAILYPQETMQRMRGDRIEAAGKGAQGHAMMAQLFRTSADLLNNPTRPEEVQRLLKGIAPGSNFEKLVASGNFDEARKAALQMAADEDKKATQEKQRQVELGNRAVQKLEEQIAIAQQQKKTEEEINQLIAQRDELTGKLVERYADLEEASADMESVSQRTINLLQQQQQLMENIARIHHQFSSGTATSQLDSRLAGMRQQEAVLAATIKALEGRGDSRSMQTAERLREQLRSLRGDISATDSPSNRAFAQIMDARALGGARGVQRAEGFGVGFTDAEKLLNQEAAIVQRLQQLRQTTVGRPLNDFELGEQAALHNKLFQTREQIQSRINDLAREEKQIRIEAMREFQKGLLFSNPAELLQKLAVSRMNKSGRMTAGDFFGMSPESRQIFDQLNGGDAGARNREERGLLNGRDLTPEQEQAQRIQMEKEAAAARKALEIGGAWELELRARAIAASELNAFAQKVGNAGQFIGMLADIVQETVDTITAALQPLRGGSPSGALPLPQAGGFAVGAP